MNLRKETGMIFYCNKKCKKWEDRNIINSTRKKTEKSKQM